MSQYTIAFDNNVLQLHSIYLQYDYLHFSPGTLTDKNIVVNVAPAQCRELLLSRFANIILADKKQCFKHTRIMLHVLTKVGGDKQLERVYKALADGCALVSLFSRKHGWPGASFEKTVNTVELSEGKLVNSYILNVSTRWFKSPQLMSLMLLLLRSGNYAPFQGCADYNAFFDLLEKVSKERILGKDKSLFHVKDDLDLLCYYRLLLRLFFDNYRKLFSKFKVDFLWNKDLYVDKSKWRGIGAPDRVKYEGIKRILKGRSANYALSEKVRDIAKENGIHYAACLYQSGGSVL